MKRLSKSLILFFMLMVLTLIPAQSSMAASKYPAKVTKLKAKVTSDTSVQLSWSKVSGATGYSIYSVDTATGQEKKIATTKSTSCVIKNLGIEQTYKFQVYAYKKVGKKTYKSKSASNAVTIRTKMSVPGAVKNFRVVCYGDESVFLAWSAASNADKYIIYKYNAESQTYEKTASTDETNYQVKNLTEGEKYYFKIQAYHAAQGKEAYGAISDHISATAKKIDVSAVHGRYLNATVKKSTTVTVKSTGEKMTLSKGTAIIATKKGSSTITAMLKNGTQISVKGSNLTYGNLHTTKSTYSTEQKEAFVNSRGYSSSTNYLIWVNQYTLQTTIFKGSKGAWKVVRTMNCVVGQYGKTTQGVFKILKQRSTLNGRPVIYFTYNSKLKVGNAFHTTFNKYTRAAVSGGCVRLTPSNLAYLDKTCPVGTTVVSY
ncbi:MAG: fibronectin type III domain-containing protein [Lachnospiraceae bacterium]|nr:fibronectin type III domain-containing protein [Lachnospiraceae bacterium]